MPKSKDIKGKVETFVDMAIGFKFAMTEEQAIYRCFLVGIGEKCVRQVILLLELLLFFRCVGRDAQHHGTGLLYLFECVAEPARFYRSTGRVGLGEEE